MPNIPISSLPTTTTVSPSAILILDQNGTTYQGTVAQILTNETFTSPVSALSQLSDVKDVGSYAPSNGQVLTWSTTLSAWIPSTATGGGSGGESANAYDTTILAESTLTHYWKMADASGATTLLDSKGSTPLTVNGTNTLGAPSIVPDGTASFLFGGAGSDTLTASSVVPSAGPFSFEVILDPQWQQANDTTFLNWPTSSGYVSLYHRVSTITPSMYNGAEHYQGGFFGNGPFHYVYTWDGTTSSMYLNGVLVFQSTDNPGTATGNLLVGTDSGASSHFYQGYMQKLAIYNAALTPAKVLAHYAAAQLR